MFEFSELATVVKTAPCFLKMPCAPTSPTPPFSPTMVSKPGSKGKEELEWVLGATGRQNLEVLSGEHGAPTNELHPSAPMPQ